MGFDDAWLDEMRVVAARYSPEKHTYELTMKPEGSTATQIVLLNTRFFPNHPPFQFLDEMVQVGEEVKVILKSEKELELIGWKLEEKRKKMLAHPNSKFLMGSKKRNMLGGIYNATIGITESLTPYAIVDGFRFGPGEIKCLIRTKDLKASPNAKTIQWATNYGTFTYNAEKHQLMMPTATYMDIAAVSTMIQFLRKAKLI